MVAEEGAKARALLDRVIEAKGGLAMLRAIKSIKAVTATTMIARPVAEGAGGPGGPSGNIEAETTTYLQYPNRVRVETKAPQGVQIQVYDGERGWVRDPGGVHDVPDFAGPLAVSITRTVKPGSAGADLGAFWSANIT